MRTPLLFLAGLSIVVAACGGASSGSQGTAQGPEDPGHHQPTVAPWPAPESTPYGGVTYEDPGVNPYVDPDEDQVSTFGLDVDTASYTIAQRYVDDGNRPDPASVRVEEWVNAFDQGYGEPRRRRVRDRGRRRPDPVHRGRRGPAADRPPGTRRARPGTRGRRPHLRHRHVGLDGARGPARARQGRPAPARRPARPQRQRRHRHVRRRGPRPARADPCHGEQRDPRGHRAASTGRLHEPRGRPAARLRPRPRVPHRERHRPGRAGVRWRRQRRADRSRIDPRRDPSRCRGRHRARLRRRRDGQLQRHAARAARRTRATASMPT